MAHDGHSEHILWCFHGSVCQVNAENFRIWVLLFDCFVYLQNITCL